MTDPNPNPNPNRIPKRKLSLLEMAENGGPFGMAAPRNGGPTPSSDTDTQISRGVTAFPTRGFIRLFSLNKGQYHNCS